MKFPLKIKLHKFSLRITLYFFPAVVLYNIIFSAYVVENFLKNFIKVQTESVLSIKVRYASPLWGCDFENIVLNDKEGLPIFTAEKISLSWSLPSFLVGHAGIRRAEFLNPTLYYRDINGKINIESLLGPNSNDQKKEITPPSDRKEIKFFFPLKFYGMIRVRNLSLNYLRIKGLSEKKAELTDIYLSANFLTKTFRTLPLNTDAIHLFQFFSIYVNPKINPSIHVSGADGFQGRAPLKWMVYHQRDDKFDFTSEMNADLSSLKFNISNNPFLFSSKYNISYDTLNDTVSINSFNIKLQNNTLLSVRGKLINISNPDFETDLHIEESRIYFSPFLQLHSFISNIIFPNSTLWIDGIFNGFRIKGKPDKLSINGEIIFNKFLLQNPSQYINIEKLYGNLSCDIDLHSIFPFLHKPSDSKPAEKLAFGMFHELKSPDLSLFYNAAFIKANIFIDPLSGINTDAHISGLNLNPFSGPNFTGYLNADVSLHSSEDINDIQFAGTAGVLNGRLMLNRSISRNTDYFINSKGRITLKEKALNIDINEFNIDNRNKSGQHLMSLSANKRSNIFLGNAVKVELNELKFTGDTNRLLPELPGEIQFRIQPFIKFLSKGITINSDLTFYSENSSRSYKGKINIDIPFLHITDININTDIATNQSGTFINEFSFEALKGSLQGIVNGSILESNNTILPNLNLYIFMRHNEAVQVHPNLLIKGGFLADLQIKPEKIEGLIQMDNLDLNYRGENCENVNSDACFQFFLNGLNLNLPFVHLTNPVPYNLNKFPVPASSFEIFRKNKNFSINYIASTHSPRGEVFHDGFYYMGAFQSDRPGLSASIDYTNNILSADWLELLIYKSGFKNMIIKNPAPQGILEGKFIKLNLADMKPEHMEITGELQMNNLDLEPFLPRSKAKYDGRISADFNAQCSDFTEFLYNLNMRLSVHRLSSKFSGFAARIIMPDRITARMIQGTVRIPSMLLELKNGLVYSTIKIERGGIFPGLFISPSGEEIKQERIPLARFLEKAKSEARQVLLNTGD